MRALRVTLLLLLLLACVFATSAAAQYPDKPIRLIVPQAAGSATDTVARILGAELGKELAQQIVVDNRPGGALTIGLDLTAKPNPTDTRTGGCIEETSMELALPLDRQTVPCRIHVASPC